MHSGTVLYYRTVPERGDKWRALTAPLSCPMWPWWEGPEELPGGCDNPADDFHWDGHSSGILSPLYPRHSHPISSARHDFRRAAARNAEELAWGDAAYYRDVRTTGWRITATIGYLGVRAGAILGIGVRRGARDAKPTRQPANNASEV